MNGTELGDLGSRAPGADGSEDGRGEPEAARQLQSGANPQVAPTITAPTTDADEGDLGTGAGFLSFSSPLLDVPVSPQPIIATPRSGRPSLSLSFDLPPLPDLELPPPAIPSAHSATTAPSSASRPISNMDRRAMAMHSSPFGPVPTHSPRTRFHLNNSPATGGILLRPILNNTGSDSPQPEPTRERDIAESIHRAASNSPEPAFAPRDDDEPHPERAFGREKRTPHPLYTPPPRKRRRRRNRRASSVGSGRTGRSSRSARSRVKSAWRSIRRRGLRRRRRGASSYASSSSSSSSGSSGSSTGSSSRSSSTWAGWRFWRNSSSGSSSSGSSDDDSDWEVVTPQFTLLTPCLTRPQHAYPAHLFSGGGQTEGTSQPPTPGASTPLAEDSNSETSGSKSKSPVFDLMSAATVGPVLERLESFWAERRQDDGLSGDIGAGAAGAAMEPPDFDEASYFPMMDAEEMMMMDSETPAATPGITPGLSGPAKVLRGEARAVRAEEKRLGKGRGLENGPAWWLDVKCPTVADMRKLRKMLPIHPLTMEDILHRETREKIESFPALGYYFIVFRALDESYFKYTSPEASPSSSTTHVDGKSKGAEQLPGASSGQRGRVDIVEGVGGEGIEGVSVGTVELYLLVFGDGILSFHYDDITKHHERVQGKLQSFGVSRSLSSHWIAHGLMDSIVDTFFPLIDFIEGESNDIDTFLSDPFNARQPNNVGSKVAPSGVGVVAGRRVYDDDVIGIVIETANEDERQQAHIDPYAPIAVKKATVRRLADTFVLRFLPFLRLPGGLLSIFPQAWLRRKTKTYESTMLVDADGFRLFPLSAHSPVDLSLGVQGDNSNPLIGDTKFDRGVMLKRIADTRKLVTALTRLLGPKVNVVRALRKRATQSDITLFQGSSKHDISIYIGDLHDHIATMQQSLTFYDAVLSHDHPAYIGVLRLSLTSAKAGTDMALVKLYIVTLTFLPINILTGLFSGNEEVPHNGDRETHLRADGSRAPYTAFFLVIGGVCITAMATWAFIWLIFQSSKKQARRKGTALQFR